MNSELTIAALRVLQRETGTPDIVYHLAGGSSVGAAIGQPREDFFRTVVSTAELLEWLRLEARQTRLVAISSAAVYGAGHTGPISETATPTPFSPYGHHKLMMEQLCRSYASTYGQAVTVARLFSVYGPGLQKQLLWDFCAKLAAGGDTVQLGGTGEELRDWTHVQDIARALCSLADTPSSDVPIYNLGTGIATPVRAIATMLTRHWTDPENRRPAVAFSGQSRSGDPFSLVANGERLAATGFRWQIEVAKGLAQYVDWYREHGGMTS